MNGAQHAAKPFSIGNSNSIATAGGLLSAAFFVVGLGWPHEVSNCVWTPRI